MIKIDEKYFENLLFKSLQTQEGVVALQEKGLDLEYYENSKTIQQFNLKGYGIPDIVRISFQGPGIFIDIIELKVVSFDLSQLLQIGRYVTAIQRIISHDPLFKGRHTHIEAFLIVAGFDSENDYTWIDAILKDNVFVYSTEYSFNGVQFTKQFPTGWYKKDVPTQANDFINVPALKDLYKNNYRAWMDYRDRDENLPF